MKRRDFIAAAAMTASGCGAVAWPFAARAQAEAPTKRIAALSAYREDDPAGQQAYNLLWSSLSSSGWAEGRNLEIVRRWSGGSKDRAETLAKELVGLSPDLIVCNTTEVTAALLRETRTIPVLFLVVAEPVESGFVKSMSRPGGNATGFTNVEAPMAGKWVELLKEAAPSIKQIALMYMPSGTLQAAIYRDRFEAAANAFSLGARMTPVASDADIETVIASLAQEKGGLIVVPDPANVARFGTIDAACIRHGVPDIEGARLGVMNSLMAYGVDIFDIYRQAGSYVIRILRGDRPEDLPVQGPTKFELIINLKTAKALGLSIPVSLIATADEVIE